MANWNLEAAAGAPGTSLLWRGTWSAALSYNPNDGVLGSNGCGYISKTNNQNKNPVSNPSDWEMFASVGAPGPPGPMGPVGTAVPVGFIGDFGGGVAPSGWLLCYGQSISRATYSLLFTAIGTAWGVGDGSTTFQVPDLRGYVLAGKDNMGGTNANRLGSLGAEATKVGGKGGEEKHVLTVAELAAHNHNLNAYQFIGGNYGAFGANWYPNTVQVTVSYTGGDQAHNNLQLTAIVNKIIYSGV